jgi:hypothetical protein
MSGFYNDRRMQARTLDRITRMEECMAMNGRADVFTSVHKGLRKALFELAALAGAADAGSADELGALAGKAREAFHFLEHHALNEDRFLVPMMDGKAMPQGARLRADHGVLEEGLAGLKVRADELARSPAVLHGFYLALNRFISDYLRHLHEEETEVMPALHEALTDEELAGFSRQSVAATAPRDQVMMLSHMFPAMNPPELKAFFDGVRTGAPAHVIAHLEGIAERVLGEKVARIR